MESNTFFPKKELSPGMWLNRVEASGSTLEVTLEVTLAVTGGQSTKEFSEAISTWLQPGWEELREALVELGVI